MILTLFIKLDEHHVLLWDLNISEKRLVCFIVFNALLMKSTEPGFVNVRGKTWTDIALTCGAFVDCSLWVPRYLYTSITQCPDARRNGRKTAGFYQDLRCESTGDAGRFYRGCKPLQTTVSACNQGCSSPDAPQLSLDVCQLSFAFFSFLATTF
ncbi:hypothetical protein BKA81DRAFT_56294 [Phyllosticta paracitricarpa]